MRHFSSQVSKTLLLQLPSTWRGDNPASPASVIFPRSLLKTGRMQSERYGIDIALTITLTILLNESFYRSSKES